MATTLLTGPDSRSLASHRFLVVPLLACGLFALADDQSLAERLWQTDESLGSCGGQYSVGSIVTNATKESTDDSVHVSADRATLDLSGKGQISGNVVLERGGDRLETSALALDTANQVFQTPEGATIVNERFALSVDDSDVRVKDGSMRIADAEFVLLENGYRGRADSFQADTTAIAFEDGFVTRCSPEVNSWMLSARRFRLDREKEIAEAWRVRLNLGRVPVAYIPYVRFPVTGRRASGILLPELESDSLHGYELSVPLYLNLAPNYDLTLTPKLSVKRSSSVELEFRHMNTFSAASVNGILLPSDREYQKYVARLLREPRLSNEDSDMRWLVDVRQDAQWGSWDADVAYFVVSDTDFFRDFGDSLDEFDHVGLARKFGVKRTGRNIEFAIASERYDPFRNWGSYVAKLPEVNLDATRWLGPVKAEAGVTWSHIEEDRIDQLETSYRTRGQVALSLPIRRTWGFGTMRLIQSISRFDSSNSSPFERRTTSGILDLGLFFERGGTTIGEYAAIEPRVVYVRRSVKNARRYPNFDFGPTATSILTLIEPFRTVGYDQIYDLEVLSMSTNMVFQVPRPSQQRFLVQAAVSMPQQDVGEGRRGETGYGVEFKAILNNELSLAGFHLINPDSWTSRATGITYRFSKSQLDVVAQLRHQQPNELLQSFVDLRFSIDKQWKIYGRWQYDWEHSRHIESFAGFEYSGCCISYRFLWRKTLRYGFADWEDLRSRTGLHFEVSLNGLTSFGDNISSIVEKGKRLNGLLSTFASN